MSQDILQEFKPIFYPKSIAVVGASNNKGKFGTRYLEALIASGFKGGLFPVNPSGGEILGLKAYPNLASIPDPVDYVIVSIPSKFILNLLDDCTSKGVKVVQMFTAGFSETGEDEGIRLEKEIVRKAAKGGFRIIGPNCIGVYSPAHDMPFGPMDFSVEAGSVAFVSHSGGVAGNLLDDGIRQGIRFSKVVSFGNGCDLDTVDYLEYLAVDPHTRIIGAYLEGARDGRRLLELIRDISMEKPMVIFKGGRTPAGAQTAASHSGSIAGLEDIWKAAMKQVGVVKVESHEELVDTILAFQHYPQFMGNRIGVIAGLYGGGGGASVVSSDACISQGLEVPSFSEKTRSELKAILPHAGSIFRNPLDMGSVGAMLNILQRTIEIVLADPLLDLLIIHIPIDYIYTFKEICMGTADIVTKFRGSQSKPIVVISPHGSQVAPRLEFERKLCDAHIPTYPTFERAALAISNVNWYYRFRRAKQSRQ